MFPTSFLESLLARFAIFPTPADCPCLHRRRCCCCCCCSSLLSMSRVPPASYTPPPSCPFSTRNLLLTKDRPGRSSHWRIERVLSISCPLYPCLSARITPQLSRFVSSPRPPRFFFFFFISIPREMPTARRKDRVERGRKTGRGLFVFFFTPASSSAPLFLSSCFLYSFEV